MHEEELHVLYSSQHYSDKDEEEGGHVLGREQLHMGFWLGVGGLKEGDHLEDLVIGGRIRLN